MLKRTRVLPSGRVTFRDGRSGAAEMQATIGPELNEKLVEVCGELGLYDFARYTLSRELLSLGATPHKGEISQIQGYEDNLETAKRLTRKLKSIPEKILVVSPLPVSYSGVLFNKIESVSLGGGVFVEAKQVVYEKFSRSFSSKNEKNAVLRNVKLENLPKEESHFLCTWHSTFVGSFFGNNAIQSHQDKLRSFYGCLLALRVIEEDYFFEHLKQHAVIGIRDPGDSKGTIVLADPVDTDLNYFYENFDVTTTYLGESIKGENDEEGSDFIKGWEDIEEHQQRQRDVIIDDLKKLFNNDDHSRRLVTSSLWLFRSFVSTKPLDIILEATIALEVLLGDRNEASGVGLTKLLANRCAYLLGESASERQKLMADFKQIYEIRSGIVHSGLHQMSREAGRASLLARDLASQVLRRELELASE